MEKTVVYTKKGCPYCSKLLDELQEKGVDFQEVDVESDREALRVVKDEYGADRVPVLVEGDQVTVGYQGGPG